MKTLKLHSKLIDLQGQVISKFESDRILSQIRKILDLRIAGRISVTETGARIREACWKIAEDLRIDGFDLSAGSDDLLVQELPQLLKA
jgi:hypothetical protein